MSYFKNINIVDKTNEDNGLTVDSNGNASVLSKGVKVDTTVQPMLVGTNGETINTDILNAMGYTESLSDSRTIGLGNPSGIIINELYFTEIMENCAPSSISMLSTVSTTNDVLQIFRASADSFGGASIIASIPVDSSNTIDDFESNVTSDWIESNNQLIVSKNNNQHYEGNHSMKIRVKTNGAGQYISRNFSTPLDLSNDNNISFWLRQQNLNVTWYMAIGDGTNWLESQTFGSNNTNTWENVVIPFDNFTEGGTGTTDLSNITIIDFHCVTNDSSARNTFIDLLQSLFIGQSEELTMELYDFGTNNNPTNISQGTKLTFDNGTTSETLDVDGGSNRNYFYNNTRGILDTANALTIGHYYGLRFSANGNIHIYGTDSQKYSSGKTYTEVESTGALTDTNKSLIFKTEYFPEAYAVGMAGFTNAQPLNTKFYIYIKKYGENNLSHQVVSELKPYKETSFLSKFGRPYYLDSGNRFFISIDKDINSDMTQLNLFIQMVCKPITRYN